MSMDQEITESPSYILTWRQGGNRYADNISSDGVELSFPFTGHVLYGTPLWEQLSPHIKLCHVDFNKYFEKDQPLNFEIGIGNGEFIAKYAADKPNENWLGVEVFKKIFRKAESRADKVGFPNLRLIQFDAALILRLIPDNTLNSVYVNFPDPWPKSSHKKRRLLKTWFIELIVSKLKQGAILHIATDHDDYASEIAENIQEVKGIRSLFSSVYERNVTDYFPTKYFRKFATKSGAYFFRYVKE